MKQITEGVTYRATPITYKVKRGLEGGLLRIADQNCHDVTATMRTITRLLMTLRIVM